MKIVVVGDGKVGNALTKQLSREGHDVVVIDKNEATIATAMNQLDVMGVVGNGATYEVQKEAGVDQADVLIAATSTDEMNLLCCLVAKKIGAKHTIARVRNPEYMEQLSFLRDELGLSMTINPELAAAKEISRVLRFPTAMKIDVFAKGRVELVEIKLNAGNPAIGKCLREIRCAFGVKVLVCAVQRQGKVTIPTGDFELQLGDKVSLTGSPQQIEELFRAMGILKKSTHNVIIAGASRTAYYLAKELMETGTRVKIIEIDRRAAEYMSGFLPKAMIIEGDAMDQELLHEEDIENVDGFVALTGMDEENILMTMYAAKHGADKVVAKVNKLSLIDILGDSYAESFVSPKYITTNEILRYVRAMENSVGSNVEALSRIVDGNVEALEFRVREGAKVANIPLKDLNTKPNVLVACISRNRCVIIPGGDDAIRVGDGVIVIATGHTFNDIDDILR